MAQLKLRVIDKAITWSNPNKVNKKNYESEIICYRCFNIVILDLWSEDKELPVR